jgi:hypothetical protein
MLFRATVRSATRLAALYATYAHPRLPLRVILPRSTPFPSALIVIFHKLLVRPFALLISIKDHDVTSATDPSSAASCCTTILTLCLLTLSQTDDL